MFSSLTNSDLFIQSFLLHFYTPAKFWYTNVFSCFVLNDLHTLYRKGTKLNYKFYKIAHFYFSDGTDTFQNPKPASPLTLFEYALQISYPYDAHNHRSNKNIHSPSSNKSSLPNSGNLDKLFPTLSKFFYFKLFLVLCIECKLK